MSHWEHSSPARTSPRPCPRHWPASRAARAGIGWAAEGGGAEEEAGGEACEQSVISGCSGRRRKRELGIAAPSPFTYFLSPRGPRPRDGPGEGPRAPPPTARPCAPGPAGRGGAAGARLPARPPLPAPHRSLRNRLRGRASLPPWRRLGLGHSGTRSSPGASVPGPPPGLRLSCRRRSQVPAETRPPPSSGRSPRGPGRALGASRPRRPRDLRPPRLAPKTRRPPRPHGFRQLWPPQHPRAEPSISTSSQTCSPQQARFQARGPTAGGSRLGALPPRLAAPAPPAHLPHPDAGVPLPIPSIYCRQGGSEAPSPRQGVLWRRPPACLFRR